LNKGDNLFFWALSFCSSFVVVLVLVLAFHAEASVRRLVLKKISITIKRTTTRTILCHPNTLFRNV